MQQPLHPVIVLVFHHLSPSTLYLPFQLLACNVVFLDLGLQYLGVDPRVINHVGQNILEILYTHALHPTHYISNVDFNELGLLFSDGVLVFDAGRAPLPFFCGLRRGAL